LQTSGPVTYDSLAQLSGLTRGKTLKHVKILRKKGYVAIDKKARPHEVLFLSAPWRLLRTTTFDITATEKPLREKQIQARPP
ncbi:MAG: winged helix-turn-helix domain-containing protein, partial [Candidatus Hodarchaeota archaeon]